jgi:hypothetical protein
VLGSPYVGRWGLSTTRQEGDIGKDGRCTGTWAGFQGRGEI